MTARSQVLPGPQGQLAAWRQWPCRLRQAMESGHSATTGGRCLPACQGAWRTCGSFTSWTQFDTRVYDA